MVLRNTVQLIISQATFLASILSLLGREFAKIKLVRVAGLNIINDDFLLFLLRSTFCQSPYLPSPILIDPNWTAS